MIPMIPMGPMIPMSFGLIGRAAHGARLSMFCGLVGQPNRRTGVAGHEPALRASGRLSSSPMSTTQRNLLLCLSFVLAGGVAAGVWWVLDVPPEKPPVEDVKPFEPAKVGDDSSPGAGDRTRGGELEAAPPEEQPTTTVVFPLKVELELVRSEFTPQADAAPALGSAATARLKGSVHTVGDAGVRAVVNFVAGPNQGRTLYCDGTGSFGANDLYPGLSLVQVSAPMIPGSLREVRLRQDRESQLNIGYGRPGIVYGEVFDADGKLLQGAKVTLDGQVTETDDKGSFYFNGIASGEVTAYVEKPGFASTFQTLSIVAAKTVEMGTLKFRLERAARLEIAVEERLNAQIPTAVFLLPENPEGERKFPWFKINPVRVFPGGVLTVEDLPATRVAVRLFHSGSVAKPAQQTVTLVAGQTEHVSLHMQPAPVVNGVVSQDGKPVASAHVRMEVPDRSKATLSVFGQTSFLFLESEVFPNMPSAVQETLTTALGEYTLSAGEEFSKVRYLVARSPDGKCIGGETLHGGEIRVDIVLKPNVGGDGEVTLLMDQRFQPLPCEVVVNGAPRDKVLLPVNQGLHIGGLQIGSWKISVRWSTDDILLKQPIELKKEITLTIRLPQGAIDGQDKDTQLRRGKR